MGKLARQSHTSMTLYDHLRELQKRLLVIVLAVLAAGVIVYMFYAPILALLSSPLNAPLYYSTPAGGFTFVMKICLMGALIIAMPVITYNLIMFVRPAYLQALPIKKIITTSGTSTILALAGAAFAFYCILPESLTFFKGFQVSGLNALISADSYLNFVTGIISMFTIIFQIPLIISFIDRIKPFNIKKLLNINKWVVLGSLVITLLQPFTYDLVTSILIASSIIVVYNLSIVVIAIRHRQIAHQIRTAVHSAQFKPVAISEFVINDQTIESLADELARLDRPISQFIPTAIPKRTYMDISRQIAQPNVVKPAAWVEERKLKRASINQTSHAFSDIIRAPRTNCVLA